MEAKVIFFDCGGVLHSNAVPKVKEDIKSTLKLTDEQFELGWSLTMKLDYGEVTEEEYWEMFRERSGTKEPLPERSLLTRAFDEYLKVNHDVLEIVRQTSLIKRVGIISNNIAPHVRYLTDLKLFNNFPNDTIVFSNEVQMRKPNRDIYLLASDRAGVRPGEAVLIDDRIENLDGALIVGMNGILYENPSKLVEDLKDYGVCLSLPDQSS